MGVGFIVGGYCPGTSLVGAAVGKIDGVLFVLGALFGIFAFGETVGFYEEFWYSSYLGRLTIPEWLGLPYGVVVIGIVLMALFMFWGAEQLEKIFGGRDLSKEPKWRIYAGAGVLGLAVLTAFIGQPTTEQKWARIEETETARLANREVQIHPAELAKTMMDDNLSTVILDVRPEVEFNQFHLQEARHAPLAALPAMLDELQALPENAVVVVVGNDETAATEAWQYLRAESVRSAYILEGGLNNWIRLFGDEAFVAENEAAGADDDQPAFAFPAALGSAYAFAAPNETLAESFDYTPRIVLEVKRGPGGGGCG
jgi:rhodanese-related sulfurtransferase